MHVRNKCLMYSWNEGYLLDTSFTSTRLTSQSTVMPSQRRLDEAFRDILHFDCIFSAILEDTGLKFGEDFTCRIFCWSMICSL